MPEVPIAPPPTPIEPPIESPKEPIVHETARLVRATWFLGVVTLLVAGIGIWQGTITRDAVNDARTASREQSIRDSLRDIRAQEFDTAQLNRVDRQFALSQKSDSVQRHFGISQINRMGTQIKISRETMQKQLRAYIGFEAGVVDTTDFSSRLEFVNHGLTPAYHIKSLYSTRAGDMLNDGDFIFIDQNGNPAKIYTDQGILDPHVSMFIEFKSPGLTSQQKSFIRSGDGAVFYFGKIVYTDIFGKPDTTNFRMKLTIDGKGQTCLNTDRVGNSAN